MAKDEQPKAKYGIIRKMAERIQANSDDLYRSSHYSDPANKKQLQSIKADITASIKDIMDTNADNVGEPNISKLYERLFMNAQNDPTTVSDFERIFGDNEFVNNLANSYLDNRWVKQVDMEIDEVLRYMPKLNEALMTIRDNVLSSDSFSKDYLNLESKITSKEHQEQFSRNIDDMKTRYNLLKLTSDIYENISKYGEVFVYCVPYQKAIQRLLDRKDMNRGVVVKTNFGESSVIIESTTSEFEPQTISAPKGSLSGKPEDGSYGEINLNVKIESGIISSIVQNEYNARQKRYSVKAESLVESYMNEVAVLQESLSDLQNTKAYAYNRVTDNDLEMDTKLPVHHNFDQTLGDELQLPGEEDTTADGLMQSNKANSKLKDMNGCIVKILKRDRVTPIILNDICLGYYYFEFDQQQELYDDRFTTTGVVNTITGLRSNGRSEAFDSMQRREELLRNIASNLADKIDNKFVDNNQDLKKEIYYILKYNDSFNAAASSSNNIRVSYIPPDDIQHMYFNLDEDTGRGVTDLALSLIPAKLWVAIYITNCLAVMTRGNDKRVYYVRQSVESNISKTLLKTINEIKKSNFGIRQIENINSVLNITGRFNDYIIPRGADGQSPIEFEVMQGQNVEIKTDLLNLLEESAINPTGIPIEIIQNRQSPDYAMQLTMSNSKFLRFVYGRQSDFQKIIGNLYTKIYDIEYSTTDAIVVTLPPPLFINVTNTNQLVMNTSDYCENITNIVMADEQDDTVKAKFAKELKMYYLGTYFNRDVIENIARKARQGGVMSIVSNPDSIEQ